MANTSTARITVLTATAMAAFAANSVLNRIALAEGAANAMTYTGIRLASGAVTLALILAASSGGPGRVLRGSGHLGGSIGGAVALLGYAVAFSLAYLDLAAGTGALLLFASVQIGMLGWAIVQGDRPGALEWTGVLAAIVFLILLLRPGLTAPDPLGAILMVMAGLSWAAYTLIGRGSAAPLKDTGGNFIRCLPIAILLLLPGVWAQDISPAGWVYAIASGALASGLGYAVWYSVLPSLTRSTAAYVQLTVPVLAAAGGVLFIAEPLTLRLILCSAGILGGVGLAVRGAEIRRRQAAVQGGTA